MTLEWPADMVLYRSRLNAKINRNFEVFTATDFLAAIKACCTAASSLASACPSRRSWPATPPKSWTH